MHGPERWRRVLLGAVAAASLGGGAAPAAAAPKAKQAVEFTFEVRARDTRIGSGRLLVGAKAGAAKAPRLLQLAGQTEAVMGVLYQGELLAHAWVDPQWLPLAARWRSQWAGRKGHVQALLGDGRVRAIFEREGRGARETDVQVVGNVLDPVSLVPWLMQLRPQAGQAWSAMLFIGADLCRIDVVARGVEQLRQPQPGGAPRQTAAMRFEATLSQCRIQRRLTAWTALRDQQPLRLVLHDPLLGEVTLDHSATRLVAAPEVPGPPRAPLQLQVVGGAGKGPPRPAEPPQRAAE